MFSNAIPSTLSNQRQMAFWVCIQLLNSRVSAHWMTQEKSDTLKKRVLLLVQTTYLKWAKTTWFLRFVWDKLIVYVQSTLICYVNLINLNKLCGTLHFYSVFWLNNCNGTKQINKNETLMDEPLWSQKQSRCEVWSRSNISMNHDLMG